MADHLPIVIDVYSQLCIGQVFNFKALLLALTFRFDNEHAKADFTPQIDLTLKSSNFICSVNKSHTDTHSDCKTLSLVSTAHINTALPESLAIQAISSSCTHRHIHTTSSVAWISSLLLFHYLPQVTVHNDLTRQASPGTKGPFEPYNHIFL